MKIMKREIETVKNMGPQDMKNAVFKMKKFTAWA